MMRAILTYHSIDRSGSAISVSPETFRAHVEWLAASGVRVVSVPELLALPDDANALALTFDDALASVATEAAPLLAAHALPATVFVVTQHVGGDNRWGGVGDPGIAVQPVLGWDALAKLRGQGFTIGAHSRRHPHLTRCSDAELGDELAGSADDIVAALGERPTAFAYPYGSIDDRVLQAAREHFAVGCTTEFRVVTPGVAAEAVPRLDAWYFQKPSALSRWGTGGFRRSVLLRHAMRRARRMFR